MTIKRTEEYQRVSQGTDKPIKLYVCTVFPGKTEHEHLPSPGGRCTDDCGEKKTIISEEMDFVKHKLSKIKDLEPHFIWVKAGEFSHRHLKDVPDPEQIKHRNVYLDKVPDGEWLLVLDADELLFGALTNIPIILRILNANPSIDYCLLSELLPNGELKLRPRLIRKREGLIYGGPDKKHDYIEYTNHQGYDECPDYCDICTAEHTYNYIDVNAESRSWILDFLGFFHYKNGWAMELYSDDGEVKFELPPNMVHLERDAVFHSGQDDYHCFVCGELTLPHYDVCINHRDRIKQLREDEKIYNMYKEIARD